MLLAVGVGSQTVGTHEGLLETFIVGADVGDVEAGMVEALDFHIVQIRSFEHVKINNLIFLYIISFTTLLNISNPSHNPLYFDGHPRQRILRLLLSLQGKLTSTLQPNQLQLRLGEVHPSGH